MKQSKAEKIRCYIEKHPKMNNASVGNVFHVSREYIRQVKTPKNNQKREALMRCGKCTDPNKKDQIIKSTDFCRGFDLAPEFKKADPDKIKGECLYCGNFQLETEAERIKRVKEAFKEAVR